MTLMKTLRNANSGYKNLTSKLIIHLSGVPRPGTTTGLHDPSQEGCVSTDKAEDLSENGLENRNVKGKHSTPKKGTVNLKR